MGETTISELQRDAITEFLNIGMGQAAASLSEIVNEEVRLSVPTVELLSHQEVTQNLDRQGGKVLMAAIKEHFDGACWGGEALLFFPQEQGQALVRALIKEEIPHDMLAELEQDALIEVGNIVLNSCLGCCSDMLACEIVSSVPVFVVAPAGELTKDFSTRCQNDKIIFLRVGLALDTKKVMGSVVLMLETTLTESFISNINRYLLTLGFSHVE